MTVQADPVFKASKAIVYFHQDIQFNSTVTVSLNDSLYVGFFDPRFVIMGEWGSTNDCPALVRDVTLRTNIVNTPAPPTPAPPSEFAGKYAVVTQEACGEDVVDPNSCTLSRVQYIPFYNATTFSLCTENPAEITFTDLKDGYFEIAPKKGFSEGAKAFPCDSCFSLYGSPYDLPISVRCDLVSSLPPATETPSTIAPSLPPGYGVPGPPGAPGTNGQNGKNGEQGAQGAQGRWCYWSCRCTWACRRTIRTCRCTWCTRHVFDIRNPRVCGRCGLLCGRCCSSGFRMVCVPPKDTHIAR